MLREKKEIENLDFAGLTKRQIQISLLIRSIAQSFIEKVATKISLITVTRAFITRDLKQTTVYITVFPVEYEKSALDFAKRIRTDLRTEIKNKLRIRVIPKVEIKLDEEEKKRQKMEGLLKTIK